MKRLIILFRTIFAPLTTAGVMADFNLKLKQLEVVATKQRLKQAKEAAKIQKALKAQGDAENEEACARHAISSIRSLVRQPTTQTLEEIKKEMKQ